MSLFIPDDEIRPSGPAPVWTTRRHPRTMQEAFGPHTSRHVYDVHRVPRWHLWLWGAVCIGACAGIGAMLALGVRP